MLAESTPPPQEETTPASDCTSGNTEESRGSSLFAFVKAILHLPDEAAKPFVRLSFIDEDNGDEVLQTSLHTNAVPLRQNKNGYTVLAAACGR